MIRRIKRLIKRQTFYAVVENNIGFFSTGGRHASFTPKPKLFLTLSDARKSRTQSNLGDGAKIIKLKLKVKEIEGVE